MFDQLEPRRSGIVRIGLRSAFSLAAGLLLTFLANALIDTVWPYFQDKNYRPSALAVLLIRVLNLPAVIYCKFFTLPRGLSESDESLYCWSIGFVFNIPYYAIVIFVAWSLLSWQKGRRGRTKTPVVANELRD